MYPDNFRIDGRVKMDRYLVTKNYSGEQEYEWIGENKFIK